MWLFTQHGFYSITRSRTETDKNQVRAHTRRDLENLQTLTSNPAPILKTLNADYRWRIIVTPSESERIVTPLTWASTTATSKPASPCGRTRRAAGTTITGFGNFITVGNQTTTTVDAVSDQVLRPR